MKSFEINSYRHKYSFNYFRTIEEIIDEIKHEQNISLSIIDSLVLKKHPQLNSLSNLSEIIKIEVNDSTKSINNLVEILSLFSKKKIRKNHKILVVGGGTIQDIIASACCLYHRGISWIFIPTTALSQGDSCVGSKTCIDTETEKNQYGLFYPPLKILSCPEFLYSLDHIEIISGLGDILHYLLPYELSSDILIKLLDYLDDKNKLLILCSELSTKSMFLKSKMVEIDEFDNYKRHIFNFGHTFGHALEKSTNQYLPHGIAVIIGLYIALTFSKINSSIIEKQKSQIKKFLSQLTSNRIIPFYKFSLDKLTIQLARDKKNNQNDLINCILPTSLEDSLWHLNEMEPKYGLNKFNIDKNFCIKKIKDINLPNNIEFIK